MLKPNFVLYIFTYLFIYLFIYLSPLYPSLNQRPPPNASEGIWTLDTKIVSQLFYHCATAAGRSLTFIFTCCGFSQKLSKMVVLSLNFLPKTFSLYAIHQPGMTTFSRMTQVRVTFSRTTPLRVKFSTNMPWRLTFSRKKEIDENDTHHNDRDIMTLTIMKDIKMTLKWMTLSKMTLNSDIW